MEQIKEIGQDVIGNKIALSVEISKVLDKRYANFLDESGLVDDAIVDWRATLIEYIGQAMVSLDITEVIEKVTDWARQTGEGAVQYGIKIDELLITVRAYRYVVWKAIEERIDRDTCTFGMFRKLGEIVDDILHQVSFVLSETFVQFHNQTLKLANDAMLEVSTPVVSLSEEVAILPLIGELDTYRARILLESALVKCSEMENSDLIIDLSGVPIVDTAVANELLQLANALQLIGVMPTFTGLRPEIAQTMVQLGISFKEVRTAASLKHALKTQGIEIK